MEIQAVDMTTPLNVEMLKELRATLEALNEQQRMETLSIARPDPDEREMIATRKAATHAVMRAIKAFCSPLMVCANPGENVERTHR
jgi:hypothetical protein